MGSSSTFKCVRHVAFLGRIISSCVFAEAGAVTHYVSALLAALDIYTGRQMLIQTSSWTISLSRTFIRSSIPRVTLRQFSHIAALNANRRKMSSLQVSDGEQHEEGGAAPTNASSSSRPAKSPRARLTHFLAIPLHGQYYTPLPPAYASFKSAVKQFAIDETDQDGSLSDEAIIPKDAIREFNTLHLTLGVMSLTSPERVQAAISTLEKLDIKQFLPDASQLLIDLKGVESMSKKPSDIKHTGVLYIPPTDNENRLYPFALVLRDHFIKEGFIEPENRPLKLHATIVNTVYAKPPKNQHKKRGGRGGYKGRDSRITFDATEILERYDGHVFGENLEVDRVQICEMGAKKGVETVLEDGTIDIVGGGYEAVGTKLIWT
ncbi:hypothetical protein ABW19_dt0202144 [Dactylella cylindrospora]|nr:hypothetical protein ABW19_dt0202144 [Dactylella cylindrospora]